MPKSTLIGVTTLLVLRMAATARSILGNSGSLRKLATVIAGFRGRVRSVGPEIAYAAPMAARTHGVLASSHCGRRWLHAEPQGNPVRAPARSPTGIRFLVPDRVCASHECSRGTRESGYRSLARGRDCNLFLRPRLVTRAAARIDPLSSYHAFLLGHWSRQHRRLGRLDSSKQRRATPCGLGRLSTMASCASRSRCS